MSPITNRSVPGFFAVMSPVKFILSQ
jgi:hypothetical protein